MNRPHPDILYFEGQELPTGEWLAPFFEKHPSLRPQPTPGAPARGYWATYCFEDGLLTVRDIEVADARNLRTGRRSVLAAIIEEAEDRAVTSVSGLLVAPPAPAAGRRHYVLLEVRRGRLRAARSYDAAALEVFKKDQFEYFQLTEDYELLKAAAQKEFELREQEARRKDAGRGYRAFDVAAFNASVARDVLLHSKEFLAD